MRLNRIMERDLKASVTGSNWLPINVKEKMLCQTMTLEEKNIILGVIHPIFFH